MEAARTSGGARYTDDRFITSGEEFGTCASALHSGWLLKAGGSGTRRQWGRCWVYLTADRLCYSEKQTQVPAKVKYLPLDRLPVRALPRGYQPGVGVSRVDRRQVAPRGGSVFAVACGSHTHFFAAKSAQEAEAWVAHITRAWLRCVKHTARSVHPGAGELLAMREAQWSSEVESLRRMLATATEKEGGLERQLARRSLATEAGNKEDGVVHAGDAAHPPASSNVLQGVGPTPPDVAARAARHSAEAGVAGVAVPRPPLRWYTIAVRTSGARGAGGTFKVYVSLHGAAGSSALVDLPSHRGDFAAGREATFRVRAPALGPLQRLTLGVAADLAGPAGGWVPELIEVTDESAGGTATTSPASSPGSAWLHALPKKLALPGNNHFADDAGPGPGSSHFTKITVGAVLMQSGAASPGLQTVCQQLPTGRAAQPTVDGGGGGVGKAKATQAPSPAPAGPAPADVLTLTPPPRALAQPTADDGTWYTVTLYTADVAGAGTRLPVVLELRPGAAAAAGATGAVALANDGGCFVRGAADVFRFQGPDVGPLELAQLVIALDCGGAEEAGWALDSAEVCREGSSRSAHFPCGVWLDRSNGHAVVLEAEPRAEARSLEVLRTAAAAHSPQAREPQHLQGHDPQHAQHEAQPLLPASPSPLVCRYRVEIETSDFRSAGGRDHAFLAIAGDAGAAGPFLLPNFGGHHFRRGQVDCFAVEGAPDVGAPRQIELRHAGAPGHHDATWHVARVAVANETTGAAATFACGAWVDVQRVEPAVKATARALPPTHHRPQLPASPIVPPPAALPWRSPTPGAGALSSAAGAAGYRVAIHTGRGCDAGTRARPFFELVGERGSSGVVWPVGAPGAFRPGRVDVFSFPSLPSLGELLGMRVGTDGRGGPFAFQAGWLLKAVEVTHLPSKRAWLFPSAQWIDRKCHHACWLRPKHEAGGHSGGGGGFAPPVLPPRAVAPPRKADARWDGYP